MKTTYKKLLGLVMIALLFILVSDCAAFYHDYMNPCSPGENQNKVECEKWQQKYPREFKAYRKRMNLDVPTDSIN